MPARSAAASPPGFSSSPTIRLSSSGVASWQASLASLSRPARLNSAPKPRHNARPTGSRSAQPVAASTASSSSSRAVTSRDESS
eukprot:scaffold85825_cov66-Phaeocystis_antarctica.AAC.4